ncbi:UNVERIFIED_CONTAM: hypothetical protein K2H54_043045 [Gekko kuhli]
MGCQILFRVLDSSFVAHARIAFLQGERKGQENLKKDLVRRIKMLEYALKQERAKYHKLKYGTELNQGDLKMPTIESEETKDTEVPTVPHNSQLTWKQGRQLLRHSHDSEDQHPPGDLNTLLLKEKLVEIHTSSIVMDYWTQPVCMTK